MLPPHLLASRLLSLIVASVRPFIRTKRIMRSTLFHSHLLSSSVSAAATASFGYSPPARRATINSSTAVNPRYWNGPTPPLTANSSYLHQTTSQPSDWSVSLRNALFTPIRRSVEFAAARPQTALVAPPPPPPPTPPPSSSKRTPTRYSRFAPPQPQPQPQPPAPITPSRPSMASSIQFTPLSATVKRTAAVGW